MIVRYQIVVIQSCLQLMENAELVIGRIIAESKKNNGEIADGAVESIVVALQDTLHHLTMTVHITKAMETMNFEPDQEIHVLFHPLVSSYARFTVTCWHDAFHFLQRVCDKGNHCDIENMSIQVDNVLIRLCRSTFGKRTTLSCLPNAEVEDDIIALSVLHAMNSHGVTGKARFLLNTAADRALFTHNVEDNPRTSGNSLSKRWRHDYDPWLSTRRLAPSYAHDCAFPSTLLQYFWASKIILALIKGPGSKHGPAKRTN